MSGNYDYQRLLVVRSHVPGIMIPCAHSSCHGPQAPTSPGNYDSQRLLVVPGASGPQPCPGKYDSKRFLVVPGAAGPNDALGIMIPSAYSSS